MSPEVNVDSRRPSPYLQYRGHFVDKKKLTAGLVDELHAHWNDDQRHAQHLTLPWTWEQVKSAIGQRPPVPF